MSVVYALCDPDTEEIRYIGKTMTSVARRLTGHRDCMRKGRQTHLYNWMRSLSRDPVGRVLEEDPEDLVEAEIRWIAWGRSQGLRLTNLTDGGEGVPGRICSDATRAKISAANKGRKFPPEFGQRHSEAIRGSVVPQERRDRISLSLKGRSISSEHRDRIGQSKKGHSVSDETRMKISQTLKEQYLTAVAESATPSAA
jgi:hypothetical protein